MKSIVFLSFLNLIHLFQGSQSDACTRFNMEHRQKFKMKSILMLSLLNLFHFLQGSNGAMNDGDYLIIVPRVFRAGTTQNIGINIFGNKPCDVGLTLYDSTKGGVSSQARGHFQPNVAGMLELQVPEGLSNAKVGATVCGIKTAEKTVTYEALAKKVFIQTDKPIYKPGQKVLIRIICVDSQLRPAGKKVSSVVIQEPSGARIMQWNDVELQDGIASLDLQLSKELVVGKWLIKATFEGKTVTKQIEIDKYVLPKFQLDVKPPSYLAWDQREIPVSICARYSYGKLVTGRLKATLCLKYDTVERNCLTDIRNVTGCVEINARELVDPVTEYQYDTNNYHLQIQATFTETFTGIILKETARSPNMVEKSKTMSFVNIPQMFKPGFPITFKIRINYLDGKPVTYGRLRIEVSGRRFNKQSLGKIFQETYSVKNGLITVVFNNVPIYTEILNFKANYNSGQLEISKSSKALYSPSLSYLRLVLAQHVPAQVGGQGSVKVLYTVHGNMLEEIPFHYKILCKGNLKLSGVTKATRDRRLSTIGDQRPFTFNGRTIQRTSVNKFELKFNVTQDMVPSCRILVYYVKMDKETIADSIVYDVEDKLENQVSVDFVEEQKRPGQKTKIVMKAKPGSRVAISALDKSVLLLRDSEEVTKGEVMRILNRQDIGPMNARRYSKCKSPSRMPLATDVSETFNNAGVIFLTNVNIFTQPCRSPPTQPPPPPRRRYRPWYGSRRRYGGPRHGCFLGGWGMSFYSSQSRLSTPVSQNYTGPTQVTPNRTTVKYEEIKPIKKVKEVPVKIRKYFPETWLWTDLKFNETSGMQTMEVQVPDTTITSWVANGFAMSSVYGMGISNQAILKAFQPFFVQMTLPYSVIRGEETPITVTVFNYLSSCVPIKLELIRESKDYKVTSFHISKMCVCKDDGKSVKFKIIPNKLGRIPLTVKAITSEARLCPKSTVYAADAVTRKLLVEPEGIKQQYSKGTFFCATEKGKYSEMIDLALPADIIPGSVLPKISIVGDVMGPALTNLDGLLAMPYGCGEQNMAKFAPNIYVMDYLTSTNQVTKEIKDDAIRYMKSGYQRELTYKRKSGSYSAFGNSDSEGSMMLTAFVVRSFARARKYVFVDEDEIKHSIQWFRRKQKPSGCFPKYGQVFDRSLQGGLNSELTITAYVTIALLEAGFDNKTRMVSKALSCVTDNLDHIQDSYTTSLVTYTLVLADHPKAGIMMSRLKNKAVSSKDDQIFWSARNDKSAPTEEPTDYFGFQPAPADVEMTGYALMSYLKRKELLKDVIKIVKWLSKQRNDYGGFSSTQDTCIALQALSQVAQKLYTKDALMNLTVSANIKDIFSQDFTVTGSNKLILQRAEIPSNLLPNTLAIKASGKGCALLQTSVEYNILASDEVPAFKVAVSVHRREATDEDEITACYPLKLKINANWLKENVSNMAIVDVKLVSGFSVNEQALQQKLKQSEKAIEFLARNYGESEAILKRYEIDGQNIILYFDEIKTMSFSLDIIQSTLVKKTKPGVVRVYDYYDPASQAKIMYKITEKDCYGERIENECPKCLSVDDFEDLFDKNINCTSYLMRVKSIGGLMKVRKAYIKANDTQDYATFPYAIPEFCLCDEINNGVTSLVFGQSDYFRKNGEEISIVFNSGTTIAKWNGKKMRKVFREKMVQEIYQKCWGFFPG